MKVLVMFVDKFSYQPTVKTVESAVDVSTAATYTNSILAFIQVEEADEQYDAASREKKLVNHLKWTARKNNCNSIIMHSFAHLSDSKASVDFTQTIFNLTEKRLQNAGFTAAQTPFGYFLDLEIKAPGYSLARIWASL